MSKLIEIFESKRREVEAAKAAIPLDELKAQVADLPPTRGFHSALKQSKHVTALIAEVKAASPSQGTIRAHFDPVQIAGAYDRVGVDCMSVLTDRPYFGGAPENLAKVRTVSSVPLLRKDFIEDAYQIYEARVWGADACLLIVAALSSSQLVDLHGCAESLGLDVLVEVHNQIELITAMDAKCPLIGVNNRNLATFETDLTVSESLIPQCADRHTAVSESALHSHDDVVRVAACGARAVLIGTAFCQSPDIASAVRSVMDW